MKNINDYNLDTDFLISRCKEMVTANAHPDTFGKTLRHASVFLLLCRDKGGLSVLSILKADNKGYPWANQVALPGGHVDRSDESPKMAAFREVKEELNIDEENIEYIGDMGYFLTINNTQIQVFTGIWNGMDTLEVDSSEIAEVLHIPVAELLASHIDKGFSGVIPGFGDLRYPHGRLEVWGATARIFHYFIERLFFDDLKVY